MEVYITSYRGQDIPDSLCQQIMARYDACETLLNLSSAPAVSLEITVELFDYVNPSLFGALGVWQDEDGVKYLTMYLAPGGDNIGSELDDTIAHECYHVWEFIHDLPFDDRYASDYGKYPCNDLIAHTRRAGGIRLC